MKRKSIRRLFATVVVLGLALAALAFFAVRDFLAAFVLFSAVFVALGAAVLFVVAAEEGLVWAARRMEDHIRHVAKVRHLAPASHAGFLHEGLKNRH